MKLSDLLAALAVAAFISGVMSGCTAGLERQERGCSTDTECAAHCPPPADDPDCDGGPEPVEEER